MASLREALSRLLVIPGVRAVALAGREGLLIETAGRADRRMYEALAALGASVISSADTLGQEVNAGANMATILEYEGALVSIDPAGEFAIVITLAENAASLARIRHTLASSQDELLRLLDLR
jgi:predicted regulator of Ras-like GTPase activity (Roadblock/LC7/MglB family)